MVYPLVKILVVVFESILKSLLKMIVWCNFSLLSFV